jgi:hypothetical protein
MTVKNRFLVELRVEQHYENNENKGKAFRGDARKEVEEYAMDRCEINEETAISLVAKIAKSVRGEIIMPECTAKGSTMNRKGDSVKELEKAANKRDYQNMKAWKQSDYKTNPER